METTVHQRHAVTCVSVSLVYELCVLRTIKVLSTYNEVDCDVGELLLLLLLLLFVDACGRIGHCSPGLVLSHDAECVSFRGLPNGDKHATESVKESTSFSVP